MSFNLNKTDQSESKFNLSKGDKPPAIEEGKKGSRKGVWIIMVLLVFGGLAWYLLREKTATENSATAAVPTVNQEPSVTKDSPVKRPIDATENVATTRKTSDKIKPGNKNTTAESVISALQNSVPGSFDPGSSSLHPDAAVVKDMIDALSKNPRKKIIIKGYASSEGDVAVNRELSAQRATSFKNLLVSKGIAAGRIKTEAMGIEDPVATNVTEEGRKKNRRVQVTITD